MKATFTKDTLHISTENITFSIPTENLPLPREPYIMFPQLALYFYEKKHDLMVCREYPLIGVMGDPKKALKMLQEDLYQFFLTIPKEQVRQPVLLNSIY